MKEKFQLTAKTLMGLEDLLEKELTDANCLNIQPITRGFTFEGDEDLIYKLNYTSRYSLRILQEIFRFKFSSKDDFLSAFQKYEWDNFIRAEDTIAIDAVVTSCDLFDNTLYAEQVSKDGIADFYRNRYGLRPSVKKDFPDMLVNVYINENECIVSLDTSGSSLHKRGYRKFFHAAPINEVLAAGLVGLSEWDFNSDFVDPMCGSGTILMEAAMSAMNIPAGYYRKDFGFMHWQNYRPALFEKIKKAADTEIREFDYRIIGYDYSEQVVNSAIKNISAAKLKDDIEIRKANMFRERLAPNSFVIFNPPYDERLELNDAIDFYKKIGDSIKSNMKDCIVWLIVGNKELWNSIGLKPSKKIPLLNGMLESKFLRFESYEGSRKNKYKNNDDSQE